MSSLHLANLVSLGFALSCATEAFATERGMVELALQEEEKKTGKTPRTARREAYTALEQYRSVIDPENQTVIGQTFKVIQDTILDGGGGKITVEPTRDIKFIEFLNDQTLINLIPELNISSERVR